MEPNVIAMIVMASVVVFAVVVTAMDSSSFKEWWSKL